MPGLTGDEIRRRLVDARLYLCTDARGALAASDDDGNCPEDAHRLDSAETVDSADEADSASRAAPTGLDRLAAFADAVLASGVDVLQLRDKTDGAPLPARQEIAALEVLAEACARHGALLAVNDRADLALAVDADVLHLGQDDLPVTVARRILGDRPAIGRSTHDLEQAHAAAVEPGVDYFCVGPCWPTPTKPGRPAPGLTLLQHVAALGTTRPWFAIGGIDRARLPQVRDAGADRAVVVRAITDAPDPGAAAREIRQHLPTTG